MEIHDTSDDSWCNLWNDKRITKIIDWIMESQKTTKQEQVRLYTITDNFYNFIEQINYSKFESLKSFTFIRVLDTHVLK